MRKMYRTKYNTRTKQAQLDWPDLLEVYMFAKTAEGLSKATLDNKRFCTDVFVKYATDNDLKPDSLTVEHARAYVSYLRHDHVKYKNNNYLKAHHKTPGMTVASVNTHIRILRTMFNWLKTEKYVGTNPFERVGQIKEPQEVVQTLTMHQARQIIKEPDRRKYNGFRDAVLMTLILDTGLRISEAIGVEVTHIDYVSNMLYVPAENAKGGAARYVPFCQKTSRLLRELSAEVEDFGVPYLFTTIYGNKMDRSRFRQRIKQYAVDAGVTDANVSPHILRHTFAVNYLKNGGDVMSLRKILGHSTLDMVRRYTVMADKDLKHQHSKFSPASAL